MKPLKVLIVDDHVILRMGLSSLLNSRKGLSVVGEADSAESMLRKYPKLNPDVVIMDLMMPKVDGAEATRRLLESDPAAKVLILTTFGTSNALGKALDAGALGTILKNAAIEELIEAIRIVGRGGRYISPDVEALMSELKPLPELSARQTEILRLMVQCRTNQEISDALHISVDMVKEHSAALFAKLAVTNRTEAVAIALKRHLVPSESTEK